MARAYITGIGGFIGQHLCNFLIEQGYEVLGSYYDPTTDVALLPKKARIEKCDIRDATAVERAIAAAKPDVIFHLAAQSYPEVSWEKPAYTMEANAIGTINLFEAVKRLKLDPVILVACSSAEYGFVSEDEVPVKESHPLLPLHPYGVSKVAQDLLTYQYFKNDGIRGIRARIFNTTGPMKSGDVCGNFTQQAALIKKGKQEPIIKVGNLEARRAITDARDMVRAFELLARKGEPGEVYNLSGSKVYRVGDILDMLLRIADVRAEIRQDPALLRPTDEPIIYGDSAKVKAITGWKQEIPIERTLTDMLAHWMEVL